MTAAGARRGWKAHGIRIGQVIERVQQVIDGPLLRQPPRIEMHLQRTDAGCQLQQAVEWAQLQALQQRLHLEAQFQVQHRRSEFDQQIVFTRLAYADFGMAGRCRQGHRDGRVGARRSRFP